MEDPLGPVQDDPWLASRLTSMVGWVRTAMPGIPRTQESTPTVCPTGRGDRGSSVYRQWVCDGRGRDSSRPLPPELRAFVSLCPSCQTRPPSRVGREVARAAGAGTRNTPTPRHTPSGHHDSRRCSGTGRQCREGRSDGDPGRSEGRDGTPGGPGTSLQRYGSVETKTETSQRSPGRRNWRLTPRSNGG